MEWKYGICKSQGRWGETEEDMGITLKDIHRGQDKQGMTHKQGTMDDGKN